MIYNYFYIYFHAFVTFNFMIKLFIFYLIFKEKILLLSCFIYDYVINFIFKNHLNLFNNFIICFR
jgi:hypothetical protein